MLRAIETIYKGYRFRSRLEARWAVFFDALGIVWEYEQEGYDLDGLWYLPDFWFPEMGYWVEVKNKPPENYGTRDMVTGKPNLAGEEVEKATRLACLSGDDVYLLCGAIEESRRPVIVGFTHLDGEVDTEGFYAFAKCPVCSRAGIALAGLVTCLGCDCFDQLDLAIGELALKLAESDPDVGDWFARLSDSVCGQNTPSIRAAYLAAQQARFEHGESGARH